MHAITDCDTVSKPHGIGKTTALTLLKSGHFPPPLGDLNVSHDDLRVANKDPCDLIPHYYY